MADFTENIVNQRFKNVFEELEKTNRIKGKSDLAKKLGTYNHVVNSILKGDRNVTVEQLHKLFDSFDVDANYLFGLAENLFRGEHKTDDEIPARRLG
ncbi:MAG: S24 family peptidase, partial [Bacteroidota bacterium]